MRNRVEAQVVAGLPELLERVAGELRAGAAPLGAVAGTAGAMDPADPLAVDLHDVVGRAGEGGFEAALEAWALQRPFPAVRAVAAALEVAVNAGGPAAPALEGLATGLRNSQETVDEVAALSAQGRLSAVVVGGAPVVALALSLLADRRVAPTLLNTAAGRICLLAGISLEALAALWMRRILRCA